MADFLRNQDLQLILFGGKGGCGKTTSAAATALYLSQTKKILVISTDPAHSLGDSFDCKIGNKITSIKDNLWALEIKAEELLEDFKRKYGDIMKKLADRGTYFDQQDINNFFSLSLPGMDEVMAIIEMANILKTGYYDLIILDTAPTGHTIRLLALPEQMKKWIDAFYKMQEKHRYLMKHFTGRYVKDDADEFLEMMAKDLDRVKSLLRDSNLTEFVPVTIPELMSIQETERLLTTLNRNRISVKSIIVNRVVEGKDCPFCLAKKEEEERYLKEIEDKFAAYNLIKIPLFPHEIRGIKDLTELSEILFGKRSFLFMPLRGTKGDENPPLPPFGNPPSHPPLVKGGKGRLRVFASRKICFSPSLQFILLGGKGGVGKTSLAAATALYIARHHPDKKILIFSTDPAHSLSDSFGCCIENKITLIEGNLYALEINAAQLLDDLKEEFRMNIEDVFDKFLIRGIDIKFDRQIMAELISLSPPGLDEIMALKKILDFKEDEEYDLFILDTAPTGHLLRFLELPLLARDWLKTLFRLLIKYKRIVGLTRTTEKLVELSMHVKRIQEALEDSQRSEFVAITTPEIMSIAEMNRLLSNLRQLKISCRHIIVNMVIPPTLCNFCTLKRKEQQRCIQEVEEMNYLQYDITQVPLFPHEIRSIDGLEKLSGTMFGKEVP